MASQVKKKRTNADRIRQKSDEELAKWCNDYNFNCPPVECKESGCERCWLDWLKQKEDFGMVEIKMDAAQEVAIMEGAIARYGVEAQVNMAIEEMAELTKALLKLRRADCITARDVAIAAIREEMADVSIMLSQLELIYGDVADIEEAKLIRLQKRLDAPAEQDMNVPC